MDGGTVVSLWLSDEFLKGGKKQGRKREKRKLNHKISDFVIT